MESEDEFETKRRKRRRGGFKSESGRDKKERVKKEQDTEVGVNEGEPEKKKSDLKELEENLKRQTKLAKDRESRIRRKAAMTEEMKAELRRKNTECTRNRRQRLRTENPEKYEELLKRNRFRKLQKKLIMTEEELEAEKQKKFFQKQARYAKCGYSKDRPPEYREACRKRYRVWVDGMDEERKRKHLEVVSKCSKRYHQKVKLERPEVWKARMDRLKEYQRKKYKNESEEERQRRKHKEKVNATKRKLRKQWEKQQMSQQEIEERLTAVHKQMWSEFDPNWESFLNDKRLKRGKTEKTTEDVPKIQLEEKMERTLPVESEQRKPEPTLKIVASDSPPPSPSPPTSPIGNDEMYSSSDLPSADNVRVVETKPKLEVLTSKPSSSRDSMSKPVVSKATTTSTTSAISSSLYQCLECRLSYPNKVLYLNHLRNQHFEKLWICPKCCTAVLSPQELTQHFQMAHKAQPSQKPSISAETNNKSPKPILNRMSKNSLPIHTQVSRRRPNRKSLSKETKTVFPKSNAKSSAPQFSSSQKVPIRNFQCLRCLSNSSCTTAKRNSERNQMTFQKRQELWDHVKSRHPHNYWPCDYCKILKYSKASLQYHRKFCNSPEKKIK